HRGPRDVHPLLSHLRDAAHDDVVDVGGLHAGVRQRCRERLREQIDWMNGRQAALPLPPRGPDCIDDNGFCHDRLPLAAGIRQRGAVPYPCRNGFLRTIVCARSAPTETAIASTPTSCSTRST